MAAGAFGPVTRRAFLRYASAAGIVTLLPRRGVAPAAGPDVASDLEAAFASPSGDARPGALWHWMNGHVTRDGITRDLEAMQRVGIGAVVNFDAGIGIPKGPVEYLSSEWFALKAHAIREARRLGLDFVMHNCPGWSSSGGPWITPELAMQQLTWSEAHVVGGRSVEITLPQPLSRLDQYRDVAVVAYPSLPGEASLALLARRVRSSGGDVDPDALNVGDPRAVVVPQDADGDAWLLLEFHEPYEARSVAFLAAVSGDGSRRSGFSGGGAPVRLAASDDGQEFRSVMEIENAGSREPTLVSADFAPVRARFFRLSVSEPTSFSQLRFSGVARIEDWKKRANFAYNGRGLEALSDPGAAIPHDAVLDITDRMQANGRLRWQAPAGAWTLLRLGFTPIGTLNRSAPDTGVGLECDKYRAEAIAFHFEKMMQGLLPIVQEPGGAGHVGLEVDSWEVGMQNWTPGFEALFEQRAGYSLQRYLPALTGRVVGNLGTTEGFLWDLRRVQADLLADNYYGTLAELCHAHGMRLYVEPYDRGPMDEMQIGARGDVNMGEFWNGLSSTFQNNLTMRRTPKLAAAIAHVNAQRVVAAESFTGEPDSSRWQEHPFAMKPIGDLAFTHGVNRIVPHTFAHQPHPSALPGMTMGPWGIHFDWTVTWWEPGAAWVGYLARCQSLLQAGHFVADLAYFSGEDPGVYTAVQRAELTPPPPAGHDYDLIDAAVLLGDAAVVDGRLSLADGMTYRVLVLQQHPTLSLAVLRRLHALVEQGLTLVGARPVGMPGLNDRQPENLAEFARVCDALWGAPGGASGGEDAPVARRVGRGQVFGIQPLPAVFEALGLQRDFEASSHSGDAPIVYVHRRAAGADVYFVANQRRSRERTLCSFRVGDRAPELWDPATGERRVMPIFAQEAGRTRVPLDLEPYGSVFVVFREPASAVRVHGVEAAGRAVLQTTPFPEVPLQRYPDSDDFSVTLWAKPELNAMLSTDNYMEGIEDPWTDYYAIYPPSGTALYGAGHAAAGLAIGRNGVAVWERADGPPRFVLAAPTPLSGWSHVALVYEAGVPAVYVNGARVARGQRSRHRVHAGVGQARLDDGASYYNGDMTTPEVHARVLEEADLSALARGAPDMATGWERIVEPAGVTPGLRVWRNGSYRVLRSDGNASAFQIDGLLEPIVVPGPWDVTFPPGRGAPETLRLPELISLHRHDVEGVRYFSGTATYRTQIVIPSQALAGARLLSLDLGRVEVMAEVWLNGERLGVLWTRPFLIDVTRVARPGVNQLEVKVTNLWPNRLIGDEQLPAEARFRPGAGASGLASLFGGAIETLPEWYVQGDDKPPGGRVTFATWQHYTADAPLLESGLIGPVVLRPAAWHPLDLRP